MLEPRDEWIQKRAYAIWEEEGYPLGRDMMHWQQASSERIALEETTGAEGKVDAKVKVKRKPAVTAAVVAETAADKPAAKRAPKKAVKAKA
ncbi:DUF2934 domain-containing protein [Rhizobium sp. P38BS-XIX]|uniref:DUF2934 domain-containing protein n=1 Tax=Rhizobium sp. P38BS-XIX TaxID=2726740 RepID=UPI00145683AE|nr:DUF2934 domain-containing protein [Rhizobium sp. P38BS-XIX]NLR97788.1 DUF2934 domain-containing protein [Rhizobium sp. P38BS-XIX]